MRGQCHADILVLIRMWERHYGKVINRHVADSLTNNIFDDDFGDVMHDHSSPGESAVR